MGEILAPSVTVGVYERLRGDIVTCQLPPGLRLNIAELASALEVSVGVVREALSKLSAEGLVTAESGRGYQVAPVSAAELADLCRVRTEVECWALRRSMELGDVDWEVGLVSACHRLSRIRDDAGGGTHVGEEWAAAHGAFHAALVAACDSPWTLRVRDMLYTQSERYRRCSVLASRGARDHADEHRRLMELALERDVEAAVAALRAHLSATVEFVLGAAAR
jgi:DNA-binding GntR family transcriptional regulator